MRLHHIGVVVHDLSTSGESYETCLGFERAGDAIHDPIQKVIVQFWRDSTGNLIELIQPASHDSPVNAALRKGGGLNHLCFEVEDLDEEIRTAIARGAITVSEPAPATAFSGRRIAFLYFRELNLIEFVEAARR